METSFLINDVTFNIAMGIITLAVATIAGIASEQDFPTNPNQRINR